MTQNSFRNLHDSDMILPGESVKNLCRQWQDVSLFASLSSGKHSQDGAQQAQTLTVKTFSGCPRALMLVSWICLRIIQASSCFPTWQEGTERQREREGERWDTFVGSATIWLWDSDSLTFETVATPHHYMPLIYFYFLNGTTMMSDTVVTHFTSKDNYPEAVDL